MSERDAVRSSTSRAAPAPFAEDSLSTSGRAFALPAGYVQYYGIQSGLSQLGDPSAVHEAAAAGTSGAADSLPHFDTIQRSFGRYDVSGIQAHTDAKAAAGTRAIGAEAFASGDHVAFGAAPSLFTAAHEAAHVVQQRAGVHLSGGIGQADDEHERHADAVAARVVEGRSAEALLDQRAGGAATKTSVQRKVQRIVKVKGDREYGPNDVKHDEWASLTKAKRDPQAFLVLSADDWARLEKKDMKNIRVLKPARHLIGEYHNKSAFAKAVADWGWGAQFLLEAFTDHALIREPAAETKLKQDAQNPLRGGKALEDRVAKQILVVNMSEYHVAVLRRLKQKQKQSALTEDDVSSGKSNAKLLRGHLGNLQEVNESLKAYKHDNKREDLPGLQGIRQLAEIKGKQELLTKLNENLAKTSYTVEWAFKKMDKLAQMLDAMAMALLGIAHDEGKQLFQDSGLDGNRAIFRKNPEDAGDAGALPVNAFREYHMGQKIKALSLPGLVKVGLGHITSLAQQKLPDTVVYDSYEDFLDATLAVRALP